MMEYKLTYHLLNGSSGRPSDMAMAIIEGQFEAMVKAYFVLVSSHVIESEYGPTLVCIWLKGPVV